MPKNAAGDDALRMLSHKTMKRAYLTPEVEQQRGQNVRRRSRRFDSARVWINERSAPGARDQGWPSRRPNNTSTKFMTVLAASAHIAAVRKSAVRLCCSA